MTQDAAHASSIHCQRLSVRFTGNAVAVRDVDLQIHSGEILLLIGPSGCGKTTLLRALAGLQAPTEGSIVAEPPVASRQGGIGFVFQHPVLLGWRTALQNVMLPMQLIARPRVEARECAEAMLHQVGLGDALHRFPHQLSGGMQMRVSIARALVTQPRVLLLDEPFAAIDDMLRNQLGELMLALWEQQRFTAVMVTHNIAEAVLLSHRIAVMREGGLDAPIVNPLPWPREESLRSSSRFGEFYGQISRRLRGES